VPDDAFSFTLPADLPVREINQINPPEIFAKVFYVVLATYQEATSAKK
jgi:hypothetical protein